MEKYGKNEWIALFSIRKFTLLLNTVYCIVGTGGKNGYGGLISLEYRTAGCNCKTNLERVQEHKKYVINFISVKCASMKKETFSRTHIFIEMLKQ